MKSIFKSSGVLFLSLTFFFIGFNLKADNPSEGKTKTITFTVNGACGMCETRIEEGMMLIKGVKMADWDKMAQEITVAYNSKKLTEQDIHEAVAALGHDTDKVKANSETYGALPGCCRYRELEVH
jgi:copper chaperone CopZ